MGIKGNKPLLKGVSYVDDGHSNLFNITKMQLEGWILGGDKQGIWLQKDANQKLNFDI